MFTGDIRVVGSLGDYVLSASGALSSQVTNAGDEFKEVALATGKKSYTGAKLVKNQ